MTTTTSLLRTLALSTALAFAGGAALAAGSDDNNNANDTPALKCKAGEVKKRVKKNGKWVKICVPAEESGLSDEELYDQGVALAKSGHYDWALKVLAQIKDQNNPDVLNYTGYSHRKAGRLDAGVAFYKKALEINPNFVLAREYLGEGYVAAGRVDLAMVQLNEIGTRCGVTCDEYTALKKVIDSAG